jgi:hypothetical protein
MVLGRVFYFMLAMGLSTLIKGEFLYSSAVSNANQLVKNR